MFERFTDRARRVIVVSEEEARSLRHSFIQPQHIYLGLLQGDGVAATVLARYGAQRDRALAVFADEIRAGDDAKQAAKVPFSPQAKKVLELSLREALQLGHNYIGTEHILLGLIRQVDQEGDSQWLAAASGADPGSLRASVEEHLSGLGYKYSRSPALVEATGRARATAGSDPVTTGHLLIAMLDDPRCIASRALETLGVTKDGVEAQLALVSIDETSDAMPAPVRVEIRLGGSTLTIDDPIVGSALNELTHEQIRELLRDAVGRERRRRRPRAAG